MKITRYIVAKEGTRKANLGVFSSDGRRELRVKRLAGVATTIFLAWVVVFSVLLGTPSLMSGEAEAPAGARGPYNARIDAIHLHAARQVSNTAQKCGKTPSRIVFSHVSDQQSRAHLSLSQDCDISHTVVADWISVSQTADQFAVKLATIDERKGIETAINKAQNAVELFANVKFTLGNNPKKYLQNLRIPNTKEQVLKGLLDGVNFLMLNGICLDITPLTGAQVTAFSHFLETATSTLATAGIQSCLIVSANQTTWRNVINIQEFDHVILQAFRDPWLGSTPQYLADNEWFKETVRIALQHINPKKLVIALGNFSVDWISGQPIPKQLSYAKAMAKITQNKGRVMYHPKIGNTYGRFIDSNKRLHKIWMLDAASVQNQLAMLETMGVNNIGIWSLGNEDSGIWPILSTSKNDVKTIEALVSEVNLDSFVHYEGEGPFLDVQTVGTPGRRSFKVDPQTKMVTKMHYDMLPSPARIRRYGQPARDELILTFDDGPNPDFTPKILDVLKATNTPATFYVLGNKVMQHSDIVERIRDEGHEIGSHSFAHPRMDLVSQSRARAEISSTQAMLSSTLNQNALLYREPFLRSGGPLQTSRVFSLIEAQNMGHVIGGMDIVPKDWEGWSAEKIVAYVVREVETGNGHVILLHDGGENRAATVAAVPKIIEVLTQKGYRFITSAKALGVTKQDLMPITTGVRPVFERYSFGLVFGIWSFIKAALVMVLVIGLCRAALIFGFYLQRKRHRSLDKSYLPKVSVVIPAYNEGKVINDSINNVLQSDYPHFNIIVVNDGSNDDTLEKLENFKDNHLVTVISQTNCGKWAALNRAVAMTDSEIVVNIDADTRISPDAITKLTEHFVNPSIGAVSGKIIVGNRVNLISRLQALEYITAQGFDRRAFDRVNGIMVVSGAIGAWRVTALHKAGLFSPRTLTEDADMTISVLRAGFRIIYDERARAYTEAPITVRALLAQRLRWSLGMFQTAWCHKKALLESQSKCRITILDMLIFGYILPLLAPIADFLVLILLFNFVQSPWTGDVGTAPTLLPFGLIAAYLVLPMVDFILAFVALSNDKDENLKLLWLFPLQRFFYRQLLYLSVFRAITRAILGTLSSWAKGKRTGMDPIEYLNRQNG